MMIKTQNETKKLLILMLIAFSFGVLARLYWISYASAIPSFHYNNQIMINTNDGYFYAEGARDLIKGSHEMGDRSGVDEPVAIATSVLYKVLPFSFDTLILYMPVVFGSLIVVPIILLARSLNQTMVGFFASMFAVITYSYYNRTMAGYYDSDMFALITPPFVAAFLISYFKEKRTVWQVLFLLTLSLSKILYPQSFVWMAATIGFALVYTLVFDRKDKSVYLTLALALVAVSDVPTLAKVILIAASAYFEDKIISKTALLAIFAAACIGVFAYFGGLDPIIAELKAYIFKNSSQVQTSLRFYDVVQTVREAGKMDPNLFASRISGSFIVFLASLVGYALFIKQEKLLALTLPVFGLGMFAYFGGLRFTVYAVPYAALGLFYLVYLGVKKLKEEGRLASFSIAFVLTSIPNFYHIYDYKVSTVFDATTAKQVSDLGKIAKHEDYVFAWWDYGYPIRYYADVKNHSDGGKHDGSTNFIESFIICSNSQVAAANMMRESVEGYEELIKRGEEQKKGTLEHLLESKGIAPKNYDSYLKIIASPDFKARAKTRDVYLFLPYEMLEILPTIKLFSNINLLDGTKMSEPYFDLFTDFTENENEINLGVAVINKKDKTIKIGDKPLSLKSISTSYTSTNGTQVVKTQKISDSADLHLISLPGYHAYILADDEMFNSLFIQMFIFDNYDKNLFEKVSSTPQAKIFRLKI